MAIELTDDGTLDTVLRCSECGEEFRFNYEPSVLSDEDSANRRQSADLEDYNIWIDECIADVGEWHDCSLGDTSDID